MTQRRTITHETYITLPGSLDDIVVRLLQKQQALREQGADDFRLEFLGHRGLAVTYTIAETPEQEAERERAMSQRMAEARAAALEERRRAAHYQRKLDSLKDMRREQNENGLREAAEKMGYTIEKIGDNYIAVDVEKPMTGRPNRVDDGGTHFGT